MVYFLHAMFYKSEDAVFDMSKLIEFQTATDKRYNMALHLNETILQLTIACVPLTEKKARDELFTAMDENDLHKDWSKMLVVTNTDPSDVPKQYINGTLTKNSG
ncbi:hypothetical protein FVEN_g9462 [Fusarium venenatum]|uniref:Uncharacterized protein n=1 Tax=Fusarium venenatum TaxID=56646 RepID=A0A2L2TPP8_9HYPO|nr:uncharacterized protein FVRRES_05881 [Fusarium venenatum]KAG8352674.1 hypothetical protein FVEN_g9462 [Fusarium venenatum]CEI61445.1 unnamed protein product [Fusarium venenatum]